MVFTLEAMRARHGDALILHYGTDAAPRMLLIDAGPGGAFTETVRHRLRALLDTLRQRGLVAADGPLPLDLIVVSHLDDDHVGGLLELTGELTADPSQAPWLTTKAVWNNTFADLADDTEGVLAAARAPNHDAAHVVTVGQGRTFRSHSEQLNWPINVPFDGHVQAPESGGRSVPLDADTDLFVIAPRATQIEGLRKEWVKQMRRIRAREASAAQVAEYLDRSPYNLSSIVFLARQGGRQMLLTGDGRGDHILQGLDAAGVTDAGKLHVDILKLPHHGSIRDVDTDFFERITADHYVISANGRDGNPETETLDMIAASRSGDDFTIHLTYTTGREDYDQRLQEFKSRQQAAGRQFGVASRDDPDLSLKIDLADPVAI